MNDKEYYARLRREMEKKKAAQPPVKTPTKRRTAKALVGKSIKNPVADAKSNNPITNDDILNLRIAAETSDDVLEFIRRI